MFTERKALSCIPDEPLHPKGAVRLIFDRLENRMGTFEFASVFEYILTDHGSEFGNPDALGTGVTGIQRSSIYYCDPMQSGQKGVLEQAHTMLRMILPKEPVLNSLRNGT